MNLHLKKSALAITRTKCSARACKDLQTGYSLIELMVATAIGLIISAGAAALFANTILNTKTLTSASRIQEAGTQTMNMLSRHLRMAGYADWLSNRNLRSNIIDVSQTGSGYNLNPSASSEPFTAAFATPALTGCSGGYATPSSLADNTCASGSSSTAHALTVAYQVISTPDIGGAPALPNAHNGKIGMTGDCTNSAVTNSSSSNVIAVNRFYLGSTNQIFCIGNGNPAGVPQPMASNIEQFVVQYGVPVFNATGSSSPSNDVVLESYLDASQVTATNAWSRVVSVRLCILVAGEAGTAVEANGTANTNRLDCAAQPITLGSDRRLRQAFVQTVALRNKIHSSH